MPSPRGNRYTGFVALLSIMCWPILPALAAVAQTDVLPISIVDNRVFVGVTINGQGPYSFLVDTGSSGTTISPDVARQLHLRGVGDGTGGGAGEKRVSYSNFHIASVGLGSRSIGPLDAPGIDLSQLAQVVGFQRCDGVLGAELFQKNIVTIDEDRGTLTVQGAQAFKPPAGTIGVPISFVPAPDDDGMPIVNGEVNSTGGKFEIDTGDRSSVTLFGPFWRAHRLDRFIGPTVTAMTGYGVGGPIRSIVGRPGNFAMRGLALPPPVTRLSLQKAGAFTSADYAGSIGMGVLKRFVVSFDYPHRMMWLLKSAQFGAPDQYDRSGLWLGLAGARGLKVVDVAVGSPAAQAGVVAGDEVERINDMPANPGTLFSLRALLRAPGLRDVAVSLRRNGGRKMLRFAALDQIAPAVGR